VPVHGAAPQAKIMAYKVLSAVGSGAVASIVAGIEDASSATHDHRSAEAGGARDQSESGRCRRAGLCRCSIAADNAALAGAVVVASAGNAGLGTWKIRRPVLER
jgi:hypothetical protein